MMHVAQQPEPTSPDFDFDREVRRPGRQLLMELRGAPNTPKRPGPKRKAVTRITATLLERSPFWTRCLPALAEAYGNVCAYACVRIDPITGAPTVDHWKPKERHPEDAFEWVNFRFTCLTMNRRKGVDESLCDPFVVEDAWFELNLITFALRPAAGLPAALRTQVEHTIETLELDREPMRKRREAAWKLYEEAPSPHTWALVERDCPLVTRQYVLQRGAPPHDASA